MAKPAVTLCLVLGLLTANVARVQGDEADLSKKFEDNVRIFVRQVEDITEPMWDTVTDKFAPSRGTGPGVSSVSTQQRSLLGTVVDCSKAFVLSISEPSYALLGAGVYLYAHVRALLHGMVDCVRSNGLVAPVALPVCVAKYSSYAITGIAKSQYKMLLKAFESFADTVTFKWYSGC